MARFVENPNFWPTFERATALALNDVGDDIRSEAAQNIAPHSRSVPPNIVSFPPRRQLGGWTVVTKLRRDGFKGNFMEDGTQPRRLKRGATGRGKMSAGAMRGAFRGSMPATPFMRPARDEVVRRGLPIRRYL